LAHLYWVEAHKGIVGNISNGSFRDPCGSLRYGGNTYSELENARSVWLRCVHGLHVKAVFI
jgi:hypothetical protein